TRGLAAPIALHAGWNIAQHLLLSPGNATRPNLSTRPNRRGIRRNAGDRGTRDDGGGGRDLQSPSSSKITYIGRHRWGTWRLAWGEVNRRQRPSFSAGETFSDARASLPVRGASGWAGIVFNFYPSRDSSPWRAAPGSKRRYGTAGNSYVSVVDFGPVVKARSIRVFGQSGDPKSPHYQDQGELYARGGFQARLVHARRDQGPPGAGLSSRGAIDGLKAIARQHYGHGNDRLVEFSESSRCAAASSPRWCRPRLRLPRPARRTPSPPSRSAASSTLPGGVPSARPLLGLLIPCPGPCNTPMRAPGVTWDAHNGSLDARNATLGPCNESLRPCNLTLGPHSVTLGPHSVTLRLHIVTLGPCNATLRPCN